MRESQLISHQDSMPSSQYCNFLHNLITMAGIVNPIPQIERCLVPAWLTICCLFDQLCLVTTDSPPMVQDKALKTDTQ